VFFVSQLLLRAIVVYSQICVFVNQLLLRAVVDYIADLTVSNKDFEVVKHDLSTTYINMSLKAHKLNQLVKTSSIRLNRLQEYSS